VLISSPEEDAGEMELRVEGLEPGRDLAVAGDESDQRLGHDSESAQRKMRKPASPDVSYNTGRPRTLGPRINDPACACNRDDRCSSCKLYY